MIKNKRYDLNFIKNLVNLYNYKVDIHKYGIIVTPSNSDRFYQPDIMCYTDDYKYDEGGNFYINRFSIGFSGFGHFQQDKEKEDMIYNNIVKAKQLVDTLNNYVDKCNKECEKSEVIPLPPEAPPLRTISETFFQGEHYITTDRRCRICGKSIRSSSATQEVCDKCASEYKF